MEYRKFNIKKRNGTYRSIYAPDTELLQYQRSQLPKLTKIFTKLATKLNVLDCFHGFLPNKNVVTAAKQHVGYTVTLSMDISNCFDSVTPNHVPFVANTKHLFADNKAAQGFATSPLLSNIALINPISKINEALTKIFGKDNYALTIYADDITISMDTTEIKKVINISEVVTRILALYRFTINTNKTHVRWAKYGYRRVLGINVGDNDIRATRKIMRRIKAAKHIANTATDPDIKKHASYSAKGLITWSKCKLPTTLRNYNKPRFVPISNYQNISNIGYPGNCEA